MNRFLMGIASALVWGSMALAANPVVIMETSLGTIKVELFEDKAPITVGNFLQYVESKQFDNTMFHRIIDGFMIQGGGYDAEKREERPTRAPIKNESTNGMKNLRGTIAMARTSEPDSATCQFFINVVDNPRLDKENPKGDGFGNCVFGKVVDGMEVVDKIRVVKTGNGILTTKTPKGMEKTPHQNVPNDQIILKSVKKSDSK